MGWGDQNSVLVDYGINRIEIAEERYRESRYEPPFEDLPWKQDGGDNG
jgi:hypothetical protein